MGKRAYERKTYLAEILVLRKKLVYDYLQYFDAYGKSVEAPLLSFYHEKREAAVSYKNYHDSGVYAGDQMQFYLTLRLKLNLLIAEKVG